MATFIRDPVIYVYYQQGDVEIQVCLVKLTSIICTQIITFDDVANTATLIEDNTVTIAAPLKSFYDGFTLGKRSFDAIEPVPTFNEQLNNAILRINPRPKDAKLMLKFLGHYPKIGDNGKVYEFHAPADMSKRYFIRKEKLVLNDAIDHSHTLLVRSHLAPFMMIISEEPSENSWEVDRMSVHIIKHLGDFTWNRLIDACINNRMNKAISTFIPMRVDVRYTITAFDDETKQQMHKTLFNGRFEMKK